MTYADSGSVFDPQIFLSVAGAGRTYSKIPADTVIFAQGDPAHAVYYLQGGSIDVTVTSKTGKEAVLAILGSGDFFGEGCLNGEASRSSTVTAITDCTVMQVEKSAMVEALSHEPKFVGLFLHRILTRKERTEQNLPTLFFDSSEVRLAKTLLQLANLGRREGPDTVIEKISQDTLAKMVGTTRSRISYFMNKFRRQGHVDYNGEIRIRPSLSNVVLHEQPYDHGPNNE